MLLKNNSSLSIFISNLRQLQGKERDIKILSEKRKIFKNNILDTSNILKLVYFSILELPVDNIEFVKAVGSNDLKLKRAGYLGLSLLENKDFLILTVNTLMKDLRHASTRSMALEFLCNTYTGSNVFEELNEYICISNNSEKLFTKCLVAKNKLKELERINIIGSNENIIYVKLQIILDRIQKKRHHEKEENKIIYELSENDILFLTSIYPTIANRFLKVKLVSAYKILFERGLLRSDNKFFLTLENDIILAHEKIKPQIEIGLSVEILELFLMLDNVTPKVESFLFRLVDSINPNSRYFGFKFVKKYGKLTSHGIDKSIRIGIHKQDCFEMLISSINKNNYKDIYKRKEEIKYCLLKNEVEEKKALCICNHIFFEILKYANDEFYAQIYLENPELCYFKGIDRNLSDNHKKLISTKIISSHDPKYFYLFYETMNLDLKNPMSYEELFCSHLDILVTENIENRLLILDKLVVTFSKFNDLTFFRDALLQRYLKHYDQLNCSLKSVFLNSIYLFNVKSINIVNNIDKNIFIKYKISGHTLEVEFEEFMQCIEVRNGMQRARRVTVEEENNKIMHKYEIEYDDVIISIKINDITYRKEIFLK